MNYDTWFEELLAFLSEKLGDKVPVLTCLGTECPHVCIERHQLRQAFNRMSVSFSCTIVTLYAGEKEEREVAATLQKILARWVMLPSCRLVLRDPKTSLKASGKQRQLTLAYQGIVTHTLAKE